MSTDNQVTLPNQPRKDPMNKIIIATYLAAITAANLIVTEYGPAVSIYTALALVALDLTLRDVLHDRTSGVGRWLTMGVLVLGGSAISYAINRDAGPIAVASSAAFAAAMTVDALVYQAARRFAFVERSTISNIAGAIVDSLVFVTLAFPVFLWDVAVGQATAKVAGGVVFAILLASHRNRRVAEVA